MKRLLLLLISCLFLLPSMMAVGHSGMYQYSVSLTGFVSNETGKTPTAYLWIPEGCQQVKAVMFAQQNMTEEMLFKMPSFQQRMRSMSVALVWVAPWFSQNWDPSTGCQQTFEEMMVGLAGQSGHKELETAPVIPFGHSAQATFPWNFAAWNQDRTLCVISFHGDAPRTNLCGYGTANVEWGRTRHIDGIPGLMIEGEYEWWEARVRPALSFRMMYPNSCISFLADAGSGHFEVMPETADYIARFIEKAIDQRLQPDGSLRQLNPKDGWLACRYNPDLQPNDGDGAKDDIFSIAQRPVPAPYSSYQGDLHDAFWYFDKEMAELTEARYAETRGKQQREVDISDPKWHADDQTFTVKVTKGAHVEVICGPLQKINDTTFKVYPYECGSDNPRRSHTAWLIAILDGDKTYKRVVKPLEVKIPFKTDDTYTNPVLFADYSDPDVCAVGEEYYLTASSFNCIPGLPILHSKDLVNWIIIGHALQKLEPAELFDKPQHGNGVWAPSIRYHNDSLYIYWGDPDLGIFMVKTFLSPHASHRSSLNWSEPVCVISGKGMIDPCPLWDDDGRCYLVNGWANSRCGFNSVLSVRELSADGTKAVGLPRIVFDGGQENHTCEGPKFYKRDGYYWILNPAGGVENGWQLAMRSKSPYGPYEWKRVMWQGKTDINGPHQGGWVHTAQGEDWFLHFSDNGAYGRVVYLQPVDWSSGWPMMGNHGEPYTQYRKPLSDYREPISYHQENDEFENGLGLQWQWHANYHQFYGQPTADGCYRLYTIEQPKDFKSLWDVPNLLLQKPTTPCFTATAKVRFASKEDGQYGGVVMMGRDYSALVVQRQGNQFLIQRHTCKGADEGKEEARQTLATLSPTNRDTIAYAPAIYIDLYLRLTVTDGICSFSYSLDGKRFKQAGESFQMREGKWIGAKFGFVSECETLKSRRGWLDLDWIRITR